MTADVLDDRVGVCPVKCVWFVVIEPGGCVPTGLSREAPEGRAALTGRARSRERTHHHGDHAVQEVIRGGR